MKALLAAIFVIAGMPVASSAVVIYRQATNHQPLISEIIGRFPEASAKLTGLLATKASEIKVTSIEFSGADNPTRFSSKCLVRIDLNVEYTRKDESDALATTLVTVGGKEVYKKCQNLSFGSIYSLLDELTHESK